MAKSDMAGEADRKTELSRTHYNTLAQKYDESFDGKFTLPYNRKLCEHARLRDGDTVLDVACGNGRLLRMLSKRANVHAFGVDVSEEMVAAAVALTPEAVISVAPADKLSFPDNTFDVITVCCAFHHFSKPDVFMKEAHRVLKPDGILYIADPSPASVLRQIDNRLIPLMKMGDVKLYSVREILRFYEEAGYADISYTKELSRVLAEGKKRTI